MAKKATKSKSSVVKKKWYMIKAPLLFGDVKAGETLLAEPEKALDRKMNVNLMTLTGEPQKQNITVKLKINEFKDNVFNTSLEGYKMLQSGMKKFVRRNREKVDDSFVVKTKDNELLRIKPLAVTRGKTTNSTTTAIRKYIRAYLARHLSNTAYTEFVQEVLRKKIQQDLYKRLKKIHPIGVCEIRAFRLLSEREKKNPKILKPVAEKKEE